MGGAAVMPYRPDGTVPSRSPAPMSRVYQLGQAMARPDVEVLGPIHDRLEFGPGGGEAAADDHGARKMPPAYVQAGAGHASMWPNPVGQARAVTVQTPDGR